MPTSGMEVTLGVRGRSSLAYWKMSSLKELSDTSELRLATKELKEFSSKPLLERPVLE